MHIAVLPSHCLHHCKLRVYCLLQVVRALTGFAPKHSKHASLDSAVDLSFRLYKHESGAMNRVSVDEQALERAFSQDNDMVWEAVQSPRIGAVNKYAAALLVLVFQRFPLQYQWCLMCFTCLAGVNNWQACWTFPLMT